jgi:hypothetical protein
MQITAKINQLLPFQTGKGKNGPWKKQDIIVETEGKFPKKICITCWGDMADNELLKENEKILIFDVDIESREYNGRWFTDIKAWRISIPKPNEEDVVFL